MKKYYSLIIINILIIIFSLSTLNGCRRKNKIIGKKIPNNIPVAKITAVLENSKIYNDKQFVLKGLIDTQCPSNCHFFFITDTKRIKIFPKDFTLPKLEKGKKAKVYTEITVGDENIIYSAIGIEVLRRNSP